MEEPEPRAHQEGLINQGQGSWANTSGGCSQTRPRRWEGACPCPQRLLGTGRAILSPTSAAGYPGLGRAEVPGRLLIRLMKWI